MGLGRLLRDRRRHRRTRLTLTFGVVLVAVPDLTAVVLSVILGIYTILAGLALVVLGFTIRTLGKRVART